MGKARAQRIIIWIIAVVMIVGTIGSFVLMMLSQKNTQDQTAEMNKLYSQYESQVNAQTKSLSDKYYATFSTYQSQVAPFDASSVTALQTQDLTVGTGDTLSDTSSFRAYYIGWGPDGKVFDSSIDASTKSLKAPLDAGPGQVIQGWIDGVKGMKVGGVRLLTIPAAEAYGATGSGCSSSTDTSSCTIKPNTPLKFIIMTIPEADVTPPAALVQYEEQQQQAQ